MFGSSTRISRAGARITRCIGIACIAAAVSLASLSAMAVDVRTGGGATWRGDVGAQVRVVYMLAGKEVTVDGEVTKIDSKAKYVKVKLTDGGRSVERTIFWSDIRKMESAGAGATADGAAAPAGSASGGTGGTKSDGSKSATAQAGKKQVIFVMPWEGTVGVGARHDELEKIGKEADKIGEHQIIILEVISPGGLVMEGDKIDATLIELKKRHRVIAWIKEAISAAAFTSLHCDEIYFQRVGTLGAITMFAGTKSIEGAELEAWLKKVGDVCELGGRNRWIGEAMVTNKPLLSYDRDDDGNVTWYNTLQGKYKLSDEIQNLTLNADTALHCKFSDGTADTVDDLLGFLHLKKDEVEISPVGYKIHKEWQNLLKTCLAEKPRTIRDYMNPAGSDDEAMTISRIRAIEKLLSWYDKCLPCLAYEGPQVPPKEELERALKDLKRQLKQIKDADRNGG